MTKQTVKVEGLDDVKRAFDHIAKDKFNPAKRELRAGTKAIAQETLIPHLKQSARLSGVPIAPKMADTMRAKSDRVITVVLGAVNPKLRGFRRTSKSTRGSVRGNASARAVGYRTTLAFGSDRGPWPNGRAQLKDGSLGKPVNPYDVRREPSYWFTDGVKDPQIVAAVRNAFADLLARILRTYTTGP